MYELCDGEDEAVGRRWREVSVFTLVVTTHLYTYFFLIDIRASLYCVMHITTG